MLVHLDTIWAKFEGQGHWSKFMVIGGNVAKVFRTTSSEENSNKINYCRQGGCVIVVVSLSVCLSVCLPVC